MMAAVIRSAFIFLGLLLPAMLALAEEVADGVAHQLVLDGSLRTGHWSSSMNLDGDHDLLTGAIWLKAHTRLDDSASMLVEGWFMNDDAARGDGRNAAMREGYLSFSAGDVDFRIGRHIIVWGRADRMNPTDNLSPRNFTLPVPEDDDQRSGAHAVKGTYNFADWSLTGTWLPEFRPNVLPLPHAPGLRFSERIPHGQGGAFKVEQSGGAIDWSVSYYDGLDLNPDLSLESVDAAGMTLRQDHHRIRVFGADVATVVGRYGLRGEAAYTITEDSDGRDPFVKNPFFHLVVGGDRTFFEYLNVNLQYYLRRVAGHEDALAVGDPLLRSVAIQQAVTGNQFDRFQHGMTFRIGNKWLHETMEGEIAGVVSFTRRDYVLKPKLVYAFDDHWKGTLGANLFRGDANTFYGQLQDNSNVFAEVKYGF